MIFVLGLARKLAFLAVFGLLTGGITTLGHPRVGDAPSWLKVMPGYSAGPAAGDHCFQVLVTAMRNERAVGVWECFSPKLQQTFFSGAGWRGDADFQAKYLDHFKTGNIRLDVATFAGNPTCIDSATGKVCNAYLLYITPVTTEGIRLDQSAFGLAAVINAKGRIDQLV